MLPIRLVVSAPFSLDRGRDGFSPPLPLPGRHFRAVRIIFFVLCARLCDNGFYPVPTGVETGNRRFFPSRCGLRPFYSGFFVDCWPDFTDFKPESANCLPDFTDFERESANCWPYFIDFRREYDNFWPAFVDFRRESVDFWSAFIDFRREIDE
uniref:Uncharacterized protein n=1 Tax=Candidatus Kentrum sp. FM TaxID=2126340 RepID=A0A450X5E0_9GAMM|nr:MAG: hypothetical protein BECKFM1743A_GA0114220_104676 [Candidatus Kentron sp. FM]VFJ77604.1 MAG: hypothetical protein BECKFM1743C_GA0114222_110061 [Candidatus Kentron sp. FM]VFK24542.1 MAG: hypothetical protein BECKFM1743B_GA0114221_110012 [Candidatus Kentron sp. FM]